MLDGRIRLDEVLSRTARVVTLGGWVDEDPVVVTALRSGVDDESAARFADSVAQVATLDHLQLAHVREVVDGALVCDRVVGPTLRERWLDAPFELGEVLVLMDDLLEVLSYLHGRLPPLVHGYLEPGNVVLADGVPVLIDLVDTRDGVGDLGLLERYRAPEQAHTSTAPASDIYGLAALVGRLFAGRRPDDLLARGARPGWGSLPLDSPVMKLLHRMLEPAPIERPTPAAIRRRLRELVEWVEPVRSHVEAPSAMADPAESDPVLVLPARRAVVRFSTTTRALALAGLVAVGTLGALAVAWLNGGASDPGARIDAVCRRATRATSSEAEAIACLAASRDSSWFARVWRLHPTVDVARERPDLVEDLLDSDSAAERRSAVSAAFVSGPELRGRFVDRLVLEGPEGRLAKPTVLFLRKSDGDGAVALELMERDAAWIRKAAPTAAIVDEPSYWERVHRVRLMAGSDSPSRWSSPGDWLHPMLVSVATRPGPAQASALVAVDGRVEPMIYVWCGAVLAAESHPMAAPCEQQLARDRVTTMPESEALLELLSDPAHPQWPIAVRVALLTDAPLSVEAGTLDDAVASPYHEVRLAALELALVVDPDRGQALAAEWMRSDDELLRGDTAAIAGAEPGPAPDPPR
jgi:hypothetical protein